MANPRTRWVVGCMTGTSLDGLDAALVEITGEGLEMSARFVGTVSRPLGDLAEPLRSMANGEAHPPIDYMRAARRLGELHADAVEQLLRDYPPAKPGAEGKPDFVVAHGQTIWHAPRDEAGNLSWQLFDPQPIVRRLKVPVCYDLRQADLIAGGEGAPITPIADPILYPGVRTTVLNLGGTANYTSWEDDPTALIANDAYPCNMLLDGLVQRLFPGKRYDVDGELAAAGVPQERIGRVIKQAVDSQIQRRASLGRELFVNAWFDGLLDQFRNEKPNDVMASATGVVRSAISDRLPASERLIVAGGGARNREVIRGLVQNGWHHDDVLSDNFGIPCEAREAMGFAVLGALSQDGVPITLPRVTGATGPGVAGAWVYP